MYVHFEYNRSHFTTDHKKFGNNEVYCHAIKEAETTL